MKNTFTLLYVPIFRHSSFNLADSFAVYSGVIEITWKKQTNMILQGVKGGVDIFSWEKKGIAALPMLFLFQMNGWDNVSIFLVQNLRQNFRKCRSALEPIKLVRCYLIICMHVLQHIGNAWAIIFTSWYCDSVTAALDPPQQHFAILPPFVKWWFVRYGGALHAIYLICASDYLHALILRQWLMKGGSAAALEMIQHAVNIELLRNPLNALD